MEDEPLDEWAARRARSRPAPGERRAVSLGESGHGAHVDPDAPRGVQEWDGHEWTPAGVAGDLRAAADETGPDTASRAGQVPLPTFGRLPPLPPPWRPGQRWYRP
ncbi:DUF6087 family protein [Streptomyces sp. SHP 1-2]|uniref:DUF6087 family protein n=1 Tax=Streptomyces sp. SHP 1-2 TaxID=2769489 RepID=UPI0022378E64|nr:DUF6087 family protein [Streptomyces sp. SHP 1-2]MCW5254239.1 hypothetical protein [Streptomyces sp. SHP 1-2]